MNKTFGLAPAATESAVLDEAHIGHIRGALGTILHGDYGPRRTLWARWKILLAIVGPGLIVMVGDNDVGAFGTYTQAGQDYGTALLWTLPLLIAVLYVNQEMVLRLGSVSGVGHARLILERFGRFWGAFSVIDLLVLNGLTIITEFIGISLALNYLGLSRSIGVPASAVVVIIAVSTGDFRRFERFGFLLVFGSLLLVPVILMIHPPIDAVIGVLVMLSLILTLSVIFPGISGMQIAATLVGGCIAAAILAAGVRFVGVPISTAEVNSSPTEWNRTSWRMPPLSELPPAQITSLNVTWLVVLRAYLVIAAGLVLARIIALVTGG